MSRPTALRGPSPGLMPLGRLMGAALIEGVSDDTR